MAGGADAKLFGRIVLGDNVKTGANAVVNKSFPKGNCTLAGVAVHNVERLTFAISSGV